MTTPEPPQSLRDWGLSWIRTGVPVLWGLLLTFLASRAPAIYELLNNPYTAATVAGAVTLAWYAVARWVEPRLPAWLTRIIIGASTAPRYVEGTPATGGIRQFDERGPLPPASDGLRQA